MTNENTKNYYTIIKKHLGKRLPGISDEENTALCREVIFAPKKYPVTVKGKETNISAVRENLADFIERDSAEKNFIPYSLDAQIADLIESTNCETSSMNEYYRWISATYEIVRNTSDGDVTEQDLADRKDFITMSYDRESEILLCLALYEAAGIERNKEKIDLLKFKLARLREMRSIVSNTTDRVKINSEKLHLYCQYCRKLLELNYKNPQNFNLKLNLNINDNEDEELSDDFSYLDHLKKIILYMMRKFEKSSTQNQRADDTHEQEQENNTKVSAPVRSRSEHVR